MVEPVPLLLPEWSAEFTTRSGVTLEVRSASAGDEQRLIDFFHNVTPEDLRFRFLSTMKEVDPLLAHKLVDVDHSRTENLLAFDAKDGSLVASAMVAADESLERAEVAIAVRSDRKGQGIGWSLLGHACDYAAARGIGRVEAIESSQNRAAISLEKEMGFSVQPYPDDATLTLVSKDLRPGPVE